MGTPDGNMPAMSRVGTLPRPPRLPAYLREALKLVPVRPRYTPNDPLIGEYPTIERPVCAEIGLDEYYPPPSGGAPVNGVLTEGLREGSCAKCLGQTDCMIWALRNETHGLWGLTESERASLGGRAIRRDNKFDNPEQAALSALRHGIAPESLAEAIIAVHGPSLSQGRPVVTDATRIADTANHLLASA